jgi:hypothetical protein
MKTSRATAALIVCMCTAASSLAQNAGPPTQVNVSVKIIEFQSGKDVDTGLSAYLRERAKFDIYGNILPSVGAIAADLTFPTPTQAGLAVFLDRISWNDTDLELVLQALVNENRAFILSRPKVLVPVLPDKKTTIKTVQKTPYLKLSVIGQVPVTTTEYRDTGVTLTVNVPEVIDDDGDWSTNDDTYLNLKVEAQVLEEGQRISIALDQSGASGISQNAILVPEFISRSITTQVWVRNGQVLVLGGLYRNTDDKNLSTVPWLLQTEDLASGIAERVIPFSVPRSPVSSTIGSRGTSESHRELVFLIKGEIWYGGYGLGATHGFEEKADDKKKASPADVISDIVEGISGIPEGLSKKGKDDESVGGKLGGRD